MDTFDIEDFRVTAPLDLAPISKRRSSPATAHFVPGPLPVALLLMFRTPVALRVWAALHTRRRMRYSPRLAKGFIARFGLSKRDAQRGLAELERRGLVRVNRQPGRAAEVELLAVPNVEGGAGCEPAIRRGRANVEA